MLLKKEICVTPKLVLQVICAFAGLLAADRINLCFDLGKTSSTVTERLPRFLTFD